MRFFPKKKNKEKRRDMDMREKKKKEARRRSPLEPPSFGCMLCTLLGLLVSPD
jgi:hypothetical protein